MNRAIKVTTVGSSRKAHINMTTFSIGTLSPAPSPSTSSTSLWETKSHKRREWVRGNWNVCVWSDECVWFHCSIGSPEKWCNQNPFENLPQRIFFLFDSYKHSAPWAQQRDKGVYARTDFWMLHVPLVVWSEWLFWNFVPWRRKENSYVCLLLMMNCVWLLRVNRADRP